MLDQDLWKKQRFVVNHLNEADFKPIGLRPYNVYRDLGLTEATNGLVKAHVVRAAQPCKKGDTGGRHTHDLTFQFVYLLKGWQRMEIEGQGIITVHAGSSWTQPPGIKHEVLEYSDDREALEITMPATYNTAVD